MAITKTKTIHEISLFDFMSCFFTNSPEYRCLTNKAKEKHLFMFFRFMSIMYPIQIAPYANLHDVRIMDQLQKQFCRNGLRPPKWLYTKSGKDQDNAAQDSLEIEQKYLDKFAEIHQLEPKSLNFVCELMPELVKKECQKIKTGMENAPKKSKNSPKME